jgi:S-adenosylmethionine synthetase
LHGVREILLEDVVRAVFADEPIRPDERTTLALNPRGEPLPGGPASHSGLTGRKTGDDTYGEFARHSGSALSGKDPSRVERVAAYAARHAALNVVAAGLARSCEVMLSYAPGEAQPVSVNVETFGTQVIDESEITRRVTASLDFRPASVVARLGLRDLARSSADGFWPQLAAYGHMGRLDLDVPWERADAAQALR